MTHASLLLFLLSRNITTFLGKDKTFTVDTVLLVSAVMVARCDLSCCRNKIKTVKQKKEKRN
jgi:hypothetical protein